MKRLPLDVPGTVKAVISRRRRMVARCLIAAAVASTCAVPMGGSAEGANGFELVSHEPLFSRGMNSSLAMFDHYAYVGNRTDGSPTHPYPGVLVVDVAKPAHPKVVGEIDPLGQARPGVSSRELRVWPKRGLLLVMNLTSPGTCSPILHDCTVTTDPPDISVYDLAANPTNPPMVARYTTRDGSIPHEMFLWADPKRPGRALLYISTLSKDPVATNMIVLDITRARAGVFKELLRWTANPEILKVDPTAEDVRLHAVSVSPNGRRAYLSYRGAGFLVGDSSDLADAVSRPKFRLITPAKHRAQWGAPGVHSAIKLGGRPYVLTTDEVYGKLVSGSSIDPVFQGCPWGWARVIDIRNEARPRIVAEYRAKQNTRQFCETTQPNPTMAFTCDLAGPLTDNFTVYSSHNPTATTNMAFVSWHSGGLQAIDLSRPTSPRHAGTFVPQPLPVTLAEEPAMTVAGTSKVSVWSYPIIRDGLIYVVDVRNGLYVLRYRGRHDKEVSAIRFLEGNSNLGDAARLN